MTILQEIVIRYETRKIPDWAPGDPEWIPDEDLAVPGESRDRWMNRNRPVTIPEYIPGDPVQNPEYSGFYTGQPISCITVRF